MADDDDETVIERVERAVADAHAEDVDAIEMVAVVVDDIVRIEL